MPGPARSTRGPTCYDEALESEIHGFTGEKTPMESTTLELIEEQLRRLPPEKLPLVSEFLTALESTDDRDDLRDLLLAAETSLREDWESPEEDAAWAHL